MKTLSGGVLDTLWEGGGFVLSRTTLPDGPVPVLVLAPASERPAAGVIARLEHAFALREELDPFGVASPSHPLARTLEKIRRSGSAVQEIILAPLSFDDMEQLVTDSLRCESNRARLLAQVVHEKTGGNPFFAIQFLTASAE